MKETDSHSTAIPIELVQKSQSGNTALHTVNSYTVFASFFRMRSFVKIKHLRNGEIHVTLSFLLM